MERQISLRAPRTGAAYSGDGWRWVEPFISTRYAAKDRTREIYLIQWRRLRLFFAESDIPGPAELTRDLVFEYPDWRCSQVKQKSGRSPKLNTALGELKLLGLIMDEAVARNIVMDNPSKRLGIGRAEVDLRPEITAGMFDLIWGELTGYPLWMRRSFWLAINTGLRFATTRLHRNQVRVATGDILIEHPKGGRRREFAIPIYDSIRGMIEEFVKSKEQFIWDAPRGTLTGLEWSRFFKASAAYVPGLCFHSTRVTFITRGMRAGIPESVMMRMVNHAEKDISRVYQRWTSEDVRRYAARLPSLAATTGDNKSKIRQRTRRKLKGTKK